MKLQPTTTLEVCEEREATIKTSKVHIKTVVKECSQLFEDTMEVWALLQKDLLV